jgi:hypothetical protein
VVALLMVDDPRGVTVQVARRVLNTLNDCLEPRDQTWPDPDMAEAATAPEDTAAALLPTRG